MTNLSLTAGTAVVVSLLLARGTLFAQLPTPPAAAPTGTPIKNEYVIERKQLKTQFETNGTSNRQLTLRVKVLTERAVREWGQWPLTYAPSTETLTVDRVRVEKPDGTIAADAAGTIQDVAVQPPGPLPVFLDLRQKQISIASLRPGDIVEVQATWRVDKPLAENQYWFEYAFTTDATVIEERLEIEVPADSSPTLRVKSGAPAEQSGGNGRVDAGRRLYTWITKNERPAAPPENEAYDPRQVDGSPAEIRLTTFTQWQDVATWYARLMAVPSSQEVDAKALELTKGITDRAKKVEAIYDYVAKEIRYLSLSFGLGRFAPHLPAEVFRNKYGDCKDKAALLAAMLQAVGIDSLPVLMHSERSLDTEVASPVEIDHVITVVPDGDDPSRWTWLDSTAEVAPVGMLGENLRDRRVMIVGNKRHAARLVRTPADPPSRWIDSVDVRGTVDAIGTLTATAVFTLTGDTEYAGRAMLRQLPADTVKQFVQGFAKMWGVSGTFSDESTSDPADTKQPFQMRLKIRAPGFVNWAAASSDFKTFPVMFFPGSDEDERRTARTLPIGTPRKVTVRTTLELPAGYTLQAPVPVKRGGKGYTYASAYSVKGTTVVIERELDIQARTIDKSAFGEYSAFATAVTADFDQKVRVTVNAPRVPVIPGDAASSELYSAAFNAYQAGNYPAALALWTRDVELDPKKVDAWNSIGLTHNQMRDYPRAVEAYQKVLALDPFNKRTYGDLGRTRHAAGQYDEAVTAFTKHLEINPLDADVMRALGGSQLELARYADAAASLEKANSAGKPTAWTYALLGEALLRQKDTAKADAAFDKALDLSKTPAIWTKIGWVLADAGGDAARARTLSLQTLKHAATSLQDLDARSVTESTTDLIERVAWSWDALALLALQRGDLAEAERYARAAWMLGREAGMAITLGQIYEKQKKMAEAANYYLTAYAISPTPSTEIRAHVKRVVGGDDSIKQLLPAARMLAASLVQLPDRVGSGTARFTVVVNADGKVVDVAFKDGDETMRAVEPSLRGIRPDVEFPAGGPSKLALTLYVGCEPKRGVCGVSSILPSAVNPK
jgi:tetratricopeptide (TPR) repeat protein